MNEHMVCFLCCSRKLKMMLKARKTTLRNSLRKLVVKEWLKKWSIDISVVFRNALGLDFYVTLLEISAVIMSVHHLCHIGKRSAMMLVVHVIRLSDFDRERSESLAMAALLAVLLYVC